MKSEYLQRALAIAAVGAFYYAIPRFDPANAVSLRHWTLIAFVGGMIAINLIRWVMEMQGGKKES